MIMNEQAIKYVPEFMNSNRIYLQKITYKPDSLVLLLASSKDKSEFHIKFNSIYSFGLADEGDLLNYLPGIHVGIYLIENSQYLKWFHEQNNNSYINENILHFVIGTPNEVIDVLSSEKPELRSNIIV